VDELNLQHFGSNVTPFSFSGALFLKSVEIVSAVERGVDNRLLIFVLVSDRTVLMVFDTIISLTPLFSSRSFTPWFSAGKGLYRVNV